MIGALVQYPATDGAVRDFRSCASGRTRPSALVTAATDLLSLTLLAPPGEWGADIAVGNTQRFGVPMGYGGPHAAFFATRDEYKRLLPGRIIGVSRDRDGPARAPHGAADPRAAHPAREGDEQRVHRAGAAGGHGEHVRGVPRPRRPPADRASGCTAGPWCWRTRSAGFGYRVVHDSFFDTICVEVPEWALPRVLDAARARMINLRPLPPTRLCIALDETVTLGDLADLIAVFSLNEALPFMLEDIGQQVERAIPPSAGPHDSAYLTHPVFHLHHSETEMLRYIKRLEARDLSLTTR